jgi:class 3 adenylate cyclase
VAQFEGTLDQFSGDGIMVFFNDPVAVVAASRMAAATECIADSSSVAVLAAVLAAIPDTLLPDLNSALEKVE